jgi:tRNA G10  N-methylase Trm11
MANYQIHQGNNVDTLRQYEDCHFDAIITDPPYGIEFLGKDWDNNTGAVTQVLWRLGRNVSECSNQADTCWHFQRHEPIIILPPT